MTSKTVGKLERPNLNNLRASVLVAVSDFASSLNRSAKSLIEMIDQVYKGSVDESLKVIFGYQLAMFSSMDSYERIHDASKSYYEFYHLENKFHGDYLKNEAVSSLVYT